VVTGAGFVEFVINSRTDVYAGAEQSSSAANFGTLGITFRARKALSDREWRKALDALNCAVRANGTTPLTAPRERGKASKKS
jgi:hypothetical protein